MKIIDVTLTLFAWDDIPPTSYAAHTGKFAGSSKLGLLKIETDEGITGHSFLGSAYYGADLDGPNLIKYLPCALAQGQDHHCPHGWRLRCRALGYLRQGGRPAHPSTAGFLPKPREGICKLHDIGQP
jgi:hypothetical protein